jgi:rfaE bifunctional protein nucleotidyltransferase chain/domain
MDTNANSHKIFPQRDLRKLNQQICKLKSQGKRIVFTNGCFDVLQVHHVRCLQEAKTYGDVLIVAVNTDASVRRLKGPPRPILPQKDRAEMLAALECVDYVTFFGEHTPHKILQEILPDVLAKGGDYRKSEIVGKEIVEANGGRVVRLKKWRRKTPAGDIQQRSTTHLIERIRQGSVRNKRGG